jgi:hypothetical protein
VDYLGRFVVVWILANRPVGDTRRESDVSHFVAGIAPVKSHRRPVKMTTRGLVAVASVASFLFGGAWASVGTLLWILILDPLTVANPGPAWRCHIEWGVPTEKICAPIREEDADWNCATMGNGQCGRTETEWS